MEYGNSTETDEAYFALCPTKLAKSSDAVVCALLVPDI